MTSKICKRIMHKEGNEILRSHCKKTGITRSNFISMMALAIFGVDDKCKRGISEALNDYLVKMHKYLRNSLLVSRNCAIVKASEQMMKVMTDEKWLTPNQIKIKRMHQLVVNKMLVVIAMDWIIVEGIGEIDEAEYVGVVDFRNRWKIDSDAPTFIFFSTKKISSLSEEEIEHINTKCELQYEKFSEFLDAQVSPTYDKVSNKLSNAEACMMSAGVGYFQLLVDSTGKLNPEGALLTEVDS